MKSCDGAIHMLWSWEGHLTYWGECGFDVLSPRLCWGGSAAAVGMSPSAVGLLDGYGMEQVGWLAGHWLRSPGISGPNLSHEIQKFSVSLIQGR